MLKQGSAKFVKRLLNGHSIVFITTWMNMRGYYRVGNAVADRKASQLQSLLQSVGPVINAGQEMTV